MLQIKEFDSAGEAIEYMQNLTPPAEANPLSAPASVHMQPMDPKQKRWVVKVEWSPLV
jgi:hypothetical protein